MTDPKARMEYGVDSLNKEPPHTLFKKMDMPEEVRMRFDDKNQKSGDPNRRWNYQPLLEREIWGMSCHAHSEAFDMPLSQEDIIRIWGLAKWFLHQSKALH